jgi:hypothetical protein
LEGKTNEEAGDVKDAEGASDPVIGKKIESGVNK